MAVSPFAREYPVGAPIPWHMFLFKNRWCRLAVYMFAGLFTSIFGGWQDISDMLFREGAYGWKCPQGWDPTEICDEQYEAVSWLYTTAIIACGGNALSGGLLVDLIGPMMTALIGGISFLIGLAMWAASSQSLQLYYPAFFFLAAGIYPLAIPLLEIRQMFPKWEAVIMSIVSAPQTVGPVIPLIMNRIQIAYPWVSMSWLVGGYLMVVAIPTVILLTLSLPIWRFPGVVERLKENDEADTYDAAVADGGGSKIAVLNNNKESTDNGERTPSLINFGESVLGLMEIPRTASPKDEHSLKKADVAVEIEKSKAPSSSTRGDDKGTQLQATAPSTESPEHETSSVRAFSGSNEASEPQQKSSTENGGGKEAPSMMIAVASDDTSAYPINQGSSGLEAVEADAADETCEVADNNTKEEVQDDVDQHGGKKMKVHRLDWVLLSYEMRTVEFWLFSIFTAVTSLHVGYYPTTVRAWGLDSQGEALSRFFGIITPTQMVYGIAFGFIVAYTTAVGVALILVIFSGLLFSFALIPVFGLQYVTCFLSIFIQSYVYALPWVFAGEKFANRNFGILVGIIGTFPALMYPIMFGIQMPSRFTTLYIILLATTSITLSCVVALFVRQCKGVDPRTSTVDAAAARRAASAAAPSSPVAEAHQT